MSSCLPNSIVSFCGKRLFLINYLEFSGGVANHSKVGYFMSEKITVREILHRMLYFILCGLIILGVYFIVMLVLNMFARGLFMPDESGETAVGFLGQYFWFILYTFAYGIPLYFLYFLKDSAFKVFILRITQNDFDWRNIVKQFTMRFGKYDLIAYATFSLLLLFPFKDPFDNPATLISISQMLFYMLPIPRIASYFLAVLCFTLQYYSCLCFAVRYWDRHRMHPREGNM